MGVRVWVRSINRLKVEQIQKGRTDTPLRPASMKVLFFGFDFMSPPLKPTF